MWRRILVKKIRYECMRRGRKESEVIDKASRDMGMRNRLYKLVKENKGEIEPRDLEMMEKELELEKDQASFLLF